jgi:DNA-binding IclR family transcriptional regulator
VTGALPEEVARFILQCIDSVEQLEVLLLLRESSETAWSPEAVARQLYSNPSSIARRLATLQAHQLLVTTDPPSSYRYQPRTPELNATITRLAEMYRERRVAVITLIASKPIENVRAFSDAFRLRKKDKD